MTKSSNIDDEDMSFAEQNDDIQLPQQSEYILFS